MKSPMTFVKKKEKGGIVFNRCELLLLFTLNGHILYA